MYVYLDPEPGLWTVGFYNPNGKWIPESDHNIESEAAERVAWLNGVPTEERLQQLIDERFEAFFSKEPELKAILNGKLQTKSGMIIHAPKPEFNNSGQMPISSNQFDKPLNSRL